MNLTGEKSGNVICPTPGCGAKLPYVVHGNATLLKASFPEELHVVSLLTLGAADYVHCSLCKELIDYPYNVTSFSLLSLVAFDE